MQILSTRLRHGAVAQAFHWLTVLLVGTAYVVSAGGPESRVYSAAMDLTRQTHETMGVLVFALTLLRLAWRWVDPAPEPQPMAAWMRWSSKAVHVALYGLLIGIPATGMAGAWLGGHPLTLLGSTTFGPLLSQQPELGEAVSELHETLGNAIIWLAGLHAAAALVHHFVLRDRVLGSMLPGGALSAAGRATLQKEA